MSVRIWKYVLEVNAGHPQVIGMPNAARVLHVAGQHGNVTMWVVWDSSQPNVKRTFRVIGTGWEIEDAAHQYYLGTAMIDNYVWHVFEEVKS